MPFPSLDAIIRRSGLFTGYRAAKYLREGDGAEFAGLLSGFADDSEVLYLRNDIEKILPEILDKYWGGDVVPTVETGAGAAVIILPSATARRDNLGEFQKIFAAVEPFKNLKETTDHILLNHTKRKVFRALQAGDIRRLDRVESDLVRFGRPEMFMQAVEFAGASFTRCFYSRGGTDIIPDCGHDLTKEYKKEVLKAWAAVEAHPARRETFLKGVTNQNWWLTRACETNSFYPEWGLVKGLNAICEFVPSFPPFEQALRSGMLWQINESVNDNNPRRFAAIYGRYQQNATLNAWFKEEVGSIAEIYESHGAEHAHSREILARFCLDNYLFELLAEDARRRLRPTRGSIAALNQV